MESKVRAACGTRTWMKNLLARLQVLNSVVLTNYYFLAFFFIYYYYYYFLFVTLLYLSEIAKPDVKYYQFS